MTFTICADGLTETAIDTVNVWAPDVPPPGLGFMTVMDNVPAVASRDEGTTAVNWVLPAKLVASAAPLASTTDC